MTELTLAQMIAIPCIALTYTMFAICLIEDIRVRRKLKRRQTDG